MKPNHTTITPNSLIKWIGIFAFLVMGFQMAGFAQGFKVTGTVTNNEGEPMAGATLLEANTAGVFTNEEGKYSITLSGPNASLLVSYLGYQNQIIPVEGRAVINITLEPAIKSLEEVVIVGYGTQRKSDLTGSISSVKSAAITRIPTASVEQALQGKVAGLLVTPRSGEPGQGAVLRIRGTGTLNDASPLFVVDGMLLDDINFLNPNDISSIEVLKDASSTAIYGSRGANGVIIITTQKGKAGSARFNFTSYFGNQEITRMIPLANGAEYAQLTNEVAINENRLPTYDNPEEFGEGTDWQNVIYRTAPIRSYQLSAQGVSETMDYHVSANYFSQEGILRGSGFDRLTLRINNGYQLTPFIKFGHNVSFIATQQEIGPGIVSNAYQADPTVPVRDSLGNFSNTTINAPVGNPEAVLFYNNNHGKGIRTVGNAFIDIKFLKNFLFKSSFGWDLNQNQGKNFVPVFYVSPLQQNQESRLSVFIDQSNSLLLENTLTFDKDWDSHHLNVLGGLTAQQFRFENLGGQRLNFPGETDEFLFLNAGEIEGQTNFNNAFEWSMVSFLFRTNYTLLNRYLFTATFRADGSSRFGRENRYGYFPSFAAGWNIAEESFLQNQKLITRLKLRASWGKIGNDKIGAYAGRAVVTSNLNAVFGPNEELNNGASIITLANPGIKWEETSQSDLGFEFGIMDDKLVGEVDFYRRITQDILIDVPIPAYVGAANNPVINAATVMNRGWDFNLAWRDKIGKLSYHIQGIASTVYNEVLELGGGKEEIFGGGLGVGGKLGTRTVVGLPIGAFYGYQVEGIFQNESDLLTYPTRGEEVPGDLRFKDVDQDGVITTEDRTYLGSPIPNFIYGFDGGIEIFNIDFVAEFNGVSGNKIINSKKMARFGTPNFEATFLDRWTGEGTSNTEPRVTNGGHNFEMSDRFIESGSFFRMRNIQIGYSLPESFIKKLNISQFRVYLSGTNLWTRASYSGYTPEITSSSVISVGIDNGIYPIAKTYLAGVNVSF
ncbi:MAG: TonB-dependent receptor [Bacteroidia bacterium]|nr:TonB-dependent receptor [Bacteroidia bacterium]